MASLASTFEHSSASRSSASGADGVFFERADGLGPDAEVGDGVHRALGHGVHHARLRQHVNPMGPPSRATRSTADRPPAPPPSVRPRDRPAIRRRSASPGRDRESPWIKYPRAEVTVKIDRPGAVRRPRRPRPRAEVRLARRRHRCQLPKASRFFFARVRKRSDFVLPVVADRGVAARRAWPRTAPEPSSTLLAVDRQDLPPQLRIAGRPRGSYRAGPCLQKRKYFSGTVAATAAAATCGKWLVIASARSCSSGDICTTTEPERLPKLLPADRNPRPACSWWA